MNGSLSFHRISKRFGQRRLLDVEALRLTAGQLLHLSGRNGTGKTTLLKIMAGLQRPDEAYVEIGSVRHAWHRVTDRLRREVVYLHQRPCMFDGSVTANLTYGLRVKGINGDERRERLEHALAWAELTHLAGRNARTLSGGEQQRVALARAWVLRPRILLLDEPTANMDIESREQTLFLLKRLVLEQICVVVTSHDTQAFGTLADQQLRLDNGQVHIVPAPERRTALTAASLSGVNESQAALDGQAWGTRQ